MRSVRVRNAAALLLEIAMVVLVAAAVGWFFTEEGLKTGVGNMDAGGAGCLIFFTNDSNLLAALSSLMMIPFHIRALRRGRDEIPRWALTLKFIGTTAVTVTLMVVLLFLGPIMGYAAMFEGGCLSLHLICPLLAIVTFCVCDRGGQFSKKQALWGVLPTVLYATVYLVNVIFTKIWVDFYHFNLGGYWYISYVVMLIVTYLFAFILCALHNRAERKISCQI